MLIAHPSHLSILALSFLLGVSSLILGNMANSSAVIDTTKAWECYIRQEKRDKDRNRSREHGHDKESKRCRDREKHSSSSSHNRWVSVIDEHSWSDFRLVLIDISCVVFCMSRWSSTKHSAPSATALSLFHCWMPLQWINANLLSSCGPLDKATYIPYCSILVLVQSFILFLPCSVWLYFQLASVFFFFVETNTQRGKFAEEWLKSRIQ